MSKHSVLSASSCERWWNCPGSVEACKGIPNPPNVYTAEGTVAHRLAERRLLGDLDCIPMGETIVQDGFSIEITEDMVDAVEEYVEYVQKIKDDLGPSAVIKFEEKVQLEEVNAVLFGTMDCSIVVPFKIVHIFDFKYGQGKRVSAWENKQEMYYALGKMLKEDCSEFVLHICQPRVEDGFTTYEGTAEIMDAFHADLKEHAEAALDPTAQLIPGDWCRGTFCPNRTKCTALQGLTRDLVAKDFHTVPAVDTLSIDHIKKILMYEDTIKDWMSKVRDHAKELMLKGTEIQGYKIIQSQGHAKWIDDDVIIAEFGDEYGDRIYEKKLLSPAKLEKLIGKKTLGPNFREEYTVRPETGFKIVTEDEKGEPVKTISTKEDFNE